MAVHDGEPDAAQLASQRVIAMEPPGTGGRDLPQWLRHTVHARVLARPLVGGVAAMALVPPVARERDRHVAARHLGQIGGGDHRGIGERLVEVPHQARQQLEGARAHDQLVVVGAQMLRDAARVGELAEILLLEPGAERLDRLAHRVAHERHHHARVDPARQERAERDVGHEPHAHRFRQERAQPLAVVLLAPGALGLDRERPIALDPAAVRFAHQIVRRWELLHALQDRARRRDVLEREVVGDRARIDLARHSGVEGERLELGRERQPPAVVVVVERLDAEAVAPQHQTAAPAVVEPEREHPAQVLEQAQLVLLVEVEQGLGVAVAAEAMAASCEPRLDLGPAVELAVVRHPQ